MRPAKARMRRHVSCKSLRLCGRRSRRKQYGTEKIRRNLVMKILFKKKADKTNLLCQQIWQRQLSKTKKKND
jgi:hypothetical protein